MSGLFTNNCPIPLNEATAVVAGYNNVFIEDKQPAGHFRIVIRTKEGDMRWGYWNFEPGAALELNRYLTEDGIKATQ
ncbi:MULTISPECIES: DUF905 family protein [Buttiauxella]|jgi:hypothetical protein|uniref:DUF905 family protein n=1 Tax=Enterobacterales TaxID=91347 RepID=UPI0010661EB1|nr:DUF905 family protein [Buttiauxella sp. BIGb0552]TDX11951.1 uncharacterized protein DUF905 [Buttiauxella sp. BIGb0552]